jgi:hypothetical protein
MMVLGPAILIVAFYRRRSFFDTNVRRFADNADDEESVSIINASAHAPPTNVASRPQKPTAHHGASAKPAAAFSAPTHSSIGNVDKQQAYGYGGDTDELALAAANEAGHTTSSVPSSGTYQPHYPNVSQDWLAGGQQASSTATAPKAMPAKKKRIEPRESLLSISNSAKDGDFSALHNVYRYTIDRKHHTHTTR